MYHSRYFFEHAMMRQEGVFYNVAIQAAFFAFLSRRP